MVGTVPSDNCKQKPTKLVYPTDYWPVSDSTSQKVFEDYVQKMERYLGVERTSINLGELWKKTNPVGTDECLEDYLEHVFEWVANPDQWTTFLKDFLEEYEAYYGHSPALNPQLQFKRYVRMNHKKGVELMQTFRIWYEDNVVPASVNGCSETLLVLPWSNGAPDYRDKYRESAQKFAKFTGVRFFFYNISPYTQSPELILPVGQTPFQSRFSGREEWLPVGLSVVGGRGGDVMLADLVADLKSEFSQDVDDCVLVNRDRDQRQEILHEALVGAVR
ncbi:hypothetical protein P280DRAFT_396785 [Massarina eburnea CBS 473.64]|uniref:Uncharacterized protein n=1 Tax=Massarina eburnea CBS 473.64 TaxID=1395130 RepID=A0A6A6S715_9PLEO|nr:hypothetical protein P280DRAFT_396785 [Massarina eburnea CBS 473.64]